jgi:hypothetical protein
MSNDETASTHWLIPQLDLQTQLRQEVDRRTAAHLSRDELAVLADKLIVDWYHHSELIDNLLGRVRRMEVDLALRDAKPSRPEPSEEHYKWAKQLFPET